MKIDWCLLSPGDLTTIHWWTDVWQFSAFGDIDYIDNVLEELMEGETVLIVCVKEVVVDDGLATQALVITRNANVGWIDCERVWKLRS